MKVEIEFETLKKAWAAKIKHDGKNAGEIRTLMLIFFSDNFPVYALNIPEKWLRKLIEEGEVLTLVPENPSKR